jgi:hypothetical protein
MDEPTDARKTMVPNSIARSRYTLKPGNDVAKRFIRTLKENLICVRSVATVAKLVEALRGFRLLYNERWLIGRHGYRSESQFRPEREVATRSVA